MGFRCNYTCLVDVNGALTSIYSLSNELFLSYLAHLPPHLKTSKYHHTVCYTAIHVYRTNPIQNSINKLMNALYDRKVNHKIEEEKINRVRSIAQYFHD